MSTKAKAIRTLYRMKRITIDGVRQSVEDGFVTPAEFEKITGETYSQV